jgi:hypothetical protein
METGSMPQRDPIFETDRMITTMTGFMVVALALLIGFGRETMIRHHAPPAVEVCHVSAAPDDQPPHTCRGGDCLASGKAAREAATPAPAGLEAVWRALRAGPG